MKHIGANIMVLDDLSSKTPLISVIIPVYNVENYLCECLDSVLNQTYSFFEILLIDDGSTDSSGIICDNYMEQDTRIKVIHQQNNGLGHARNIGINAAVGKYIIFLDSDDYWRFDTLESLLYEAEKHDLQVVVFSAHSFLDGIEQYNGSKYSHIVQNNIVKTGLESLLCASANGEYYSQACLRFYRLDYIKKNGFLFDEGIIHEDESFSFLTYINAERVECLGECFYQRRYRPGSIMLSREPFQSSHGYSIAIGTLLQYMKNNTLSNLEVKLFSKQILGYIFSIYRQYNKSKKWNIGCSKTFCDIYSKSIIIDTQEIIQKACRNVKGFPFHYRFLLYHFQIGFHFWLYREMLKKWSSNIFSKYL